MSNPITAICFLQLILLCSVTRSTSSPCPHPIHSWHRRWLRASLSPAKHWPKHPDSRLQTAAHRHSKHCSRSDDRLVCNLFLCISCSEPCPAFRAMVMCVWRVCSSEHGNDRLSLRSCSSAVQGVRRYNHRHSHPLRSPLRTPPAVALCQYLPSRRSLQTHPVPSRIRVRCHSSLHPLSCHLDAWLRRPRAVGWSGQRCWRNMCISVARDRRPWHMWRTRRC